MLYYLSVALYVLTCLMLLLVVLLQQGKGGDMASAFGGGGSQTAFGARAGATVLTRATTVLGIIFMLGAILLGIIGRQGPGSLMRGVSAGCAPDDGARAYALDPGKVASGSSRDSPPSRKWRNWQTHQLEGLALAIAWGFESPLSHQQLTAILERSSLSRCQGCCQI